MKANLTKTSFKSTIGRARQLLSSAACLGAVILVCSTASAQNLFVSGTDDRGGEIFKFTWDGRESIFASGLYRPWDLAFDNAGNLFFVDYEILQDGGGGLPGNAAIYNVAIYKITPNGTLTIFASRLSYPSYLATDRAGNVFAADYNQGVIYQYKPTGSRATFATGLHHPVGLAFNSLGNLFVVDNSAGMYQGHIYEYKPNGSRATFAVLDPSDRPADLAFDNMGNLFMADLGGNIYRYDPPGVLRRHPRTTFGSVPNSAQSLACDSAGNLLVVGVGDANSGGVAPNAVYKFTQQGVRSTFALAQNIDETFACLAFQPMSPVCCEAMTPSVEHDIKAAAHAIPSTDVIRSRSGNGD